MSTPDDTSFRLLDWVLSAFGGLIMLFLGLLIGGAILQTGILYSLAIGFDAMLQDIFWEDTIGITISSRAGLAARNGTLWHAKIVDFIMRSPTHCEDAIANDISRAQAALKLLNITTGNPEA